MDAYVGHFEAQALQASRQEAASGKRGRGAREDPMSTLTMSLRKALFNAPPPLPSSPPWYMICGGKRGVRTTHHTPCTHTPCDHTPCDHTPCKTTHHATTHHATTRSVSVHHQPSSFRPPPSSLPDTLHETQESGAAGNLVLGHGDTPVLAVKYHSPLQAGQ